jgi:hypothetical protein
MPVKETSVILDTLEVTSDYFKTKSHETLYRQTIRKSETINSLLKIIDVCDVKSKKQYWKTYHCKNVLIQQGNKLIGSLCRKRWCQNCNRIRTAELVNNYKQPLQDIQKEDELYFVTLTAPTVNARNLSSEITKRYKAFTRIKDNLRRNYGIKLVGIRKLEITYNPITDKYHPHFHLIQQGKQQAELIQKLWLEQPLNAGIKGQHIDLIDANNPNNLLEVFKYATKGTAKDETEAKSLHTIYKALQGKRIFQTYGKLQKVKVTTEAKEETNNADFIPTANDIYVYEHHLKDFTNANFDKLIDTIAIQKRLPKDYYDKKVVT